MDILYAFLLTGLNVIWLFLTVLGLPGNWLMIGSAGLLLWLKWTPSGVWGDQIFHPVTIGIVVGLAVLGEILEFVMSALGTKKGGGGKRASFLSLLFSFIGGIAATFMIPVPVLGTLIGACAGAFFGAWLGETSIGSNPDQSIKAGTGAAVGRLLGTVVKVFIGVTIFITITLAAFWP